jgi:lipopolysaccharide biosynthesis glycosyltransferase
MIPIFIGYDTRETIAYHVCANSIIRHASVPVSISPLSLNLLKDYVETHTDGGNQFVYTRFLVPHLMNYQGWALFVDGDMIVADDIINLWNMRDDSKAVMIVKHNYKTKATQKYLGSKNEDYPRKNWSSVILWNCSHPANKLINPLYVQTTPGSKLHRFDWLDDTLIGELPIEWNWLADEFGENQQAKLIHYTLGTPCFNEYKNTEMSAHWHNELLLASFCQQINTGED